MSPPRHCHLYLSRKCGSHGLTAAEDWRSTFVQRYREIDSLAWVKGRLCSASFGLYPPGCPVIESWNAEFLGTRMELTVEKVEYQCERRVLSRQDGVKLNLLAQNIQVRLGQHRSIWDESNDKSVSASE